MPKSKLRIIPAHFVNLIAANEANVGNARLRKCGQSPIEQTPAFDLCKALRRIGGCGHEPLPTPGSDNDRSHSKETCSLSLGSQQLAQDIRQDPTVPIIIDFNR